MISKLVFLIVIGLGVVAIAQLVRLYELSSNIKGKGEHEISSRDNNLNAKLMLAFMFVLFGGFIWLMLKFGWTGRGLAASEHGHGLDWLLNVNYWIIVPVFFITNALLFVFSYKYVRKPGVKAYYFPHDNRLELLWTIVPAVVLAFIIIFGLVKWNDATSAASDKAIRVELFSKQFDWTVRYSGKDNVLGKFDYKLTTDQNPLAIMNSETIADAIDNILNNESTGILALESKLKDRNVVLPSEDRAKFEKTLARNEEIYRKLVQMQNRHDKKLDAASYDDVILAGPVEKIYLCKGQEYEFTFRAKDVIHSAYFPNFRVQMNTVPGMTTRFKFTPDLTTKDMRIKKNDPNFNYVLLCNKICGGSHYKMYMLVEVLEKGEYNKLMKAYADGDEGMAITTHRFKDVYAKAKETPAPVEPAGDVPAGEPADTAAVVPAPVVVAKK